jgi:hypothetical protein
MAGDPVRLYQLLLDSSGNPRTFACPLGMPIYLYKKAIPKFNRKLSSTFTLLENPDPRTSAEIICAIISGTLSHVQKITAEGALTPLRHQPSFDFICEGSEVNSWWGDPLVTVVVRRITAARDLGLPADSDGQILELITITPRSRMWRNVIAGTPVDSYTQTHLLRPGDRFDPALHCEWIYGTSA